MKPLSRAAIRVDRGMIDEDGTEVYAQRAVLVVTARFGKVQLQEDYEDTERITARDLVVPAPYRTSPG